MHDVSATHWKWLAVPTRQLQASRSSTWVPIVEFMLEEAYRALQQGALRANLADLVWQEAGL